MNLRQLKHLIDLEPERQKKFLAEMLVRKVGLLKKAFDLESQKKELGILAEKIGELNSRKLISEIEGISRFSILASDMLELLEVEEKLETVIWEAEKYKRVIEELRNQIMDEFQKLIKDRKEVKHHERSKTKA